MQAHARSRKHATIVNVRWILVALACGGACGSDDPPIDVTCHPAILYLDREGGVFAPGGHDDATTNTSVLVDAERTLPAWPHDDWADIVTCIHDHLLSLPRIMVTDVDPGMTPHMTIVFTTAYWGGDATTMIVPASCRPDHQIEFVFGDAIPTTARACHLALQGFARMSANLSLGDDCHDLVNNSVDCSQDRAFLDQTVNCVDDAGAPASCRCGGTTQNTYQALTTAFPPCA